MARYYRFILLGWLLSAGFFLLFRFLGSDEKKIRNTFEEIRTSLANPPSDNLFQTATGILQILSNFSEDYSGKMEALSIRGQSELKETIACILQSFSPLDIGIFYKHIEIKNKTAVLSLEIKIIKARSQEQLKSSYQLEIQMKKEKGKWLISSSKEVF